MRWFFRGAAALAWLALLASGAFKHPASVTAGEPIPPALLADTQPLYEAADPGRAAWLQPVANVGADPVFVAGAEATFMAPIITGSFVQATAIDTFQSGDGVEVYDDIGMNLMTYAPRIWIGVAGQNGWGLVGRFWYLNDSLTASENVSFAGDQFGLYGAEDIKLYTIDLELTRHFVWGNWLMDGSFGVRHASIEHFNGVGQTSILVGGLVGTESVAQRSFNGTGITFALGGRKSLWENSALHWVWNARGSAVFGNGRFAGATSSTFLESGGSWSTDGAIESDAFQDTLFIAELQAGLQWEHRLQASPATAFFRAVFEYQYWGGVNNGSVDLTSSASLSSMATNNSVHAHGINLDLVGLSLGAGFLW